MKKILIIGSSGFLGTKLIKKLKKKYLLFCPKSKYGFDIAVKAKLEKYIKKKPDIIINLSGQILKNTIKMKDIILKGNNNLISLLKKHKLKSKVYFISTTLIYGYSKNTLNENSKKKPTQLYSKLKLQVEKNYIKSRTNYLILRLPHVYDYKKNGIVKNIINSFVSKKKLEITNMHTFRSYIHVKDFTDVFIKLMTKKLRNKIYNVSGENLSIKQIISHLEKYLNEKMIIKDKKISLRTLSSHKVKKSRLYKEINFYPKFNILNYTIKKTKNEIRLFKK